MFMYVSEVCQACTCKESVEGRTLETGPFVPGIRLTSAHCTVYVNLSTQQCQAKPLVTASFPPCTQVEPSSK